MTPSTRLAVDASSLGDGSEFRGMGTYVRALLRGLGQEPSLDVLALGGVEPLDLPGVTERPGRVRLPPRCQPWERAVRLQASLRRVDADLFHSPAQHPPRRCPVPWVQTLHDLTPLVFPHPLLERDRRRWERIGPRLRDAAAVICISRSSAEQGVRLLGLDRSRVHVVPHAVGPEFLGPATERTEETPSLLWLSSWGPHKGLREALFVLERAVEAGLPHRLVVGGRQDPWMLRQVQSEVDASPARDRVTVLGWVPDLPAVYRAADALLVTSRAEGFGLPALEAMACGVPVIAFDNTSLGEVVGDAGVLVPDGDATALWKAVERVLTTPALAAELSSAGYARARLRSWSQVIRDHVDVYDLALASSAR